MYLRKLLFILFSTAAVAIAQNNQVMLNAESDTKPREISLGLPTNTLSAVPIFEDGIQVSHYIYQLFPFKSWHGGVSALRTGTMGPFETSLRFGEINTYIDSYNRVGTEKFGGHFSYVFGTFGQHKIDANITGSLGKGWGYSLSTYQNLDPSSNHISYPYFQERHQFYKATLSKIFNEGKGQMALTYQFVHFLTIGEKFGPFTFVGDGSVEELDGFKLGTDCYLPDIRTVSYQDFETGEMKTIGLKEGNADKTHHVTYTLNYNFDNNTSLDIRSRFRGGTSTRGGAGTLAGVQNVTAESGYTYSNGKPFSGNLQRRNLQHFDAKDYCWMTNVELTRKYNQHKMRFGLDYDLNYAKTLVSSSLYAHEVKADPELLYRDGSAFYNFNATAEYYEGYDNKIAIYAKDSWKISPRFNLEGFVRAEYRNLNGNSAQNLDGSTINTRRLGFNLTQGKITDINDNFFNGAVGLDVNYNLGHGFSMLAQGVITQTNNTLFDYGGAVVQSTKPISTKFVQAGLAYKNDYVNIVSQFVFITRSNYRSRTTFQHALQKPVGNNPAGFIETSSQNINYGIQSLGWTTDAIITPFQGFQLHLGAILRDPQYKDFVFTPTFSDGVTENYDFSGKNVTALHKYEFNIDPSYSINQWRLWLTVRYISKQYVNKTNSLFFNGRWETFGGIDYRLNKKVAFNLNIINLLNQRGVSGLISSADLVEDASEYNNYLMAGTYIRPFTIEIGVKIDL